MTGKLTGAPGSPDVYVPNVVQVLVVILDPRSYLNLDPKPYPKPAARTCPEVNTRYPDIKSGRLCSLD